jgi:hypothetical protein
MSFLKAFIVVGLLPVLAMLAVGIYLQPLEGDLTRVGRVSERSWGWTKPRTVIDQLANVPTPETKIIVIGDSFSMGSLWQSVMQRASGLSFATYHWDSIGPPDCLKAALVTLLQKHPQARFVIVESVERHFVNRFSDWRGSGRNCPSAIYPSIRNVEKLGAWRKSAIDLSGGLPDAQYAFQALAAEGRSYEHAETTGQAVVAPLVRSDLFSNLRSDHLLYFAEDARRRHWTQEQVATAVGNMKTFAGAAAGLGVRPLFVIIPNKLTVCTVPEGAGRFAAGEHLVGHGCQ